MNPVTSAIMVPHPPILLPNIGRGEEKKIADIDAAYTAAARSLIDSKPDTVVIVSPHAPSYFDYMQISDGKSASGSLAQFRDPQDSFTIQYDQELIREISKLAQEEGIPAGTLGRQAKDLDHGTMIPLYYLKELLPDTRFIRIGIGGPDHLMHYRLGEILKQAALNTGRKIAVVASGDLSHCQKEGTNYGYKACGPAYDQNIMEIMGNADFLRLLEMPEAEAEEAMVCGHKPFCVLAGALDGVKPAAEALAHSAEFGVGYGVVVFSDFTDDPSRQFEKKVLEDQKAAFDQKTAGEDAYVALARKAINAIVGQGKILKPEKSLEEELLKEKAGAFVSLHKGGQLRGCIGTTAPTRSSLAEEIIQNAISASTRDPRFPAVQPWELMDLEISVDVLKEPEPVRSMEELDCRKYGVIVSKGRKRGLLLPDLEGVDSAEQQVAIARQKAGLKADETGCSLERFEVIRHH